MFSITSHTARSRFDSYSPSSWYQSLSFSVDSIVHPHLKRALRLAGFVGDGDLDCDLVLAGAVLRRDGVLARVGAARLPQRELGVVVL